MKRNVRILLIAALVFVLLFAARFAYELAGSSDAYQDGIFAPMGGMNDIQQMEAPSSISRKNYASAKIVIAQPSAPQTVEQKYERISNIDTRTTDWDADTAALRAAIESVEAMVQRENASGLPGGRSLSLSLGVVPSKFDEAVERLRGVGDLVSINTVKNDRTSDFLALEAKRLSLEKTRDGLSALRNAGASLADRMNLETRILEIEGQIQELGVSLGDFSELNSFCTVNLSLREKSGPNLGRRIVSAFFDALGWAVAVYVGLVVSLLGLLGVAYLALRIYDRLKEGSPAAESGASAKK
jgi:hypothetical protein